MGDLGIRDYIEVFGTLEEGWNFGEGKPISRNALDKAVQLVNYWDNDDNVEAFPNIDGTVTVSLQNGDKFLDIDVREESYYIIFEDGIGDDFTRFNIGEFTDYFLVLDKIDWFRDLFVDLNSFIQVLL